ncbi:MAG: FKBP-type peptidyl-prolyl cis-trans isomerase [Eubacterium sp.]|nr:FKBP-type peptidyl-prolyl cis-trans isomerase [Eubacterium sp.]
MKIAVTYDNGAVFQHFGKTEQFKVYEVEDGQVLYSEVIGTGGAGHEALAGYLAGVGADVLICGGLGSGAQQALAKARIQVCSGASGDADAAVAAFLRGELADAGVNCDHHHHDHMNAAGAAGEQEDGTSEADGNGEEAGCCESGEETGCCGSGEETGCCEDGGEAGCGGCGGDCGGCGGGCGMAGPPIEGPNAGKTCRVHYRGTFNDGTQFDSSYDRGEPIEFICGAGMMIRGFDAAVAVMEPGQTAEVHLMPEEAYGMPDPRNLFTTDVSEIPGSEELQVGQRVVLTNMSGQQFQVTVTERAGSSITFDANHEMAGKELNFVIELLEVIG